MIRPSSEQNKQLTETELRTVVGGRLDADGGEILVETGFFSFRSSFQLSVKREDADGGEILVETA